MPGCSRKRAVEAPLAAELLPQMERIFAELEQAGRTEMQAQDIPAGQIRTVRAVRLRYTGSDSALSIAADDLAELQARFEAAHRQRYGFVMPDKALIVEAAAVEVIGGNSPLPPAGEQLC